MADLIRGKRILVTGGTGFIGGHLVKRLEDFGNEICVIVKRQPQNNNLDASNTFYKPVEISDYSSIDSVIKRFRPNVIFHLAAIVTASREFSLIDKMIEVNLTGTTNILRSISELQELEVMINFGSSEEYGNQSIELKETVREEPSSPYAIFKLVTTKLCNIFSLIYNLPIITIRPANIFGPGQGLDKFIPYVITKCLNNEQINMTLGEQKRNFLYVEDFVNAILLIASKERRLEQIYNVGSDSTLTLKEITETIKRLTHSNSHINYGAIEYRTNEMMAFEMNIDKIIDLGWKQEYDLIESLKKTIEFYKRGL